MLRFLQLSDIHFRAGPADQEQRADEQALDYDLRQRLIEDARVAVSEAGGVCGVLVCGDLAYSGAGAEFAQATTWLQSLCTAIGIPPWMVWVVPGNHDIDRSGIRDEQEALRQSLRKAGDGLAAMLAAVVADTSRRASLLRPLHNYMEFASGYDCMLDEGLHWAKRFDLDGGVLELRGLTSAALCGPGDNTKDRRTVVGDHQATFASGDETAYYTLCHHPGCWLFDRNEVEAWFDDSVHIRVTGHLHRRSLQATAKGIYLKAGAVSPQRTADGSYAEPEVPAYELVFLRGLTGDGGAEVEISVSGRRWSEDDQEWQPNTAVDGTMSCAVSLGSSSFRREMPQPTATPTTRLELGIKELRYRLAQLPPYDRGQCAIAIEAPVQDIISAPGHEQVALLFGWATQNGKLRELAREVGAANGEEPGEDDRRDD